MELLEKFRLGFLQECRKADSRDSSRYIFLDGSHTFSKFSMHKSLLGKGERGSEMSKYESAFFVDNA